MIGIMLLSPIGMSASAASDSPTTYANSEPTVAEIKKQIDTIYQKSLKSFGNKFNGYCGAYVGWQVKHMGIHMKSDAKKSPVTPNGKDTWETYSKLTTTSGGYTVNKYSAMQYTLKQALNKISANGTKNVYNIMVCMQKGNTPLSYEYGHVSFIHAIINGTVYFSESANLSLSSGYYPAGSVIALSINRFCDNLFMLTGTDGNTGAKLTPVFEGVIHFTGGSGSSSSNISCSWSKDSSKAWVKNTNAQVSAKVIMSGADISDITQEGIELYDYKGTLLGSYEAKLTPSGSDTTVYLYYDINKRLGYTLSPGTSYQYKIWMKIDATKYESAVYSFETTGTHSHTWSSAGITDAGCEKAGEIVYGCVSCSATKSETVSATGHSWDSGKVTKQPTCTKAGVRTYTCTKCSGTKTEEIAATGEHLWGEWESVSEDAHKHRCTTCGKTETTEHKWNGGALTTPPTEGKDGVTTYTCLNCRKTKTKSVPSTHTHSYATVWTVDETGHWHICACGDAKDKAEHVPGAPATDETAQICTVCKYELAPALEHTHNFGEVCYNNEDGHWQECACGTKTPLEGHIWDDGEKERTCVVCGSSKTLVGDEVTPPELDVNEDAMEETSGTKDEETSQNDDFSQNDKEESEGGPWVTIAIVGGVWLVLLGLGWGIKTLVANKRKG